MAWRSGQIYDCNPAEIYREVLAFLGVEDDCRTEFVPENTRKAWRSPHVAALSRTVSRFTNRPPKWLFRAREALGLQRIGIMGALERLNTKPSPVREVSASTRASMLETFTPDIRLLESLTGRDLSRWREAAPREPAYEPGAAAPSPAR